MIKGPGEEEREKSYSSNMGLSTINKGRKSKIIRPKIIILKKISPKVLMKEKRSK